MVFIYLRTTKPQTGLPPHREPLHSGAGVGGLTVRHKQVGVGPASDRHDSLRDLFFVFRMRKCTFCVCCVCFVRYFRRCMDGMSVAREKQNSGMKKRNTNIANGNGNKRQDRHKRRTVRINFKKKSVNRRLPNVLFFSFLIGKENLKNKRALQTLMAYH